MILSRSLLVVLLVCILMTRDLGILLILLPLLIYIALLLFRFIYIALLSCSSLLLYLHCAAIFLFSSSLLRCCHCHYSVTPRRRPATRATYNKKKRATRIHETRTMRRYVECRLENNMYDVWTEAVLMYSTVHKLCLLYSTVDCTEVEYSTVDWAVHLPQKSYRSCAYCSLHMRLFVFCVLCCTQYRSNSHTETRMHN